MKQERLLNKKDADTNALIDALQKYLLNYYRGKGIRNLPITREFVWEIFTTVHKLPYLILLSRNPEIEYQGQGRHITTKKYPNQRLVIKGIGRFELKAISDKAGTRKKAKVKYTPSDDLTRYIEENVKVKGDE